jgi:hypothetical protein
VAVVPVGHQALEDDGADVTVVRVSVQASPPEETFEASLYRPVGVLGAAITRVDEFSCESVDIRLGRAIHALAAWWTGTLGWVQDGIQRCLSGLNEVIFKTPKTGAIQQSD